MDWIYRFSAEHCDWQETDKDLTKKILGGKGAGLVMMAQNGFNVPPGFTITTEVCNHYASLDEISRAHFVDKLMSKVVDHMKWLGVQFGYVPLVSVRSGAPVSMPGMMDTILNVGVTPENADDWVKRIGERSLADSTRRLIQMLGSTAYGVPHAAFEKKLQSMKQELGVDHDHELETEDLWELKDYYLDAFGEHTSTLFPWTLEEQLRAAIEAVFKSWMNPRAIEYRKLNNIDPAMGTACTVQAMVFGNMGADSGTGVLFTRNPSTGENGMTGEFLQDAQGEDVVAGIRTPMDIWDMNCVDYQDTCWPHIYTQLLDTCQALEVAYNDMVDIEFTVQQGKLFILQSRVGKRSAQAAFKIAVDLEMMGVISKDDALKRLTPEQFKIVRRPGIDPNFKLPPAKTGLPACPGVVTGVPVYSSNDAINCTFPCVLVTHETTPDDIGGMAKAAGVLTQTGGATSHAAVVARAMDKACVVGCSELDIQWMKENVKTVTICGATGKVWFDTDVPVVDSSDNYAVQKVMEWCVKQANTGESMSLPQKPLGFQGIIRVADWWGNKQVLEVVLDEIVELGPELFTLDLRSPAEFRSGGDDIVTSCFGTLDGWVSFGSTVVEAMIARGQDLKELGYIAGTVPYNLAGNTNLVEVPADQPIVDIDHRVFSVLGA